VTVAALVTLMPGATPPPGFPVNGYLPVAPQRTFTEEWLPRAERAGLQWVPLFETGTPLEPADIPYVVADLDTLAALVTAPELEHVAERIALLRDLLTSLDPASVRTLWIG
jgi:hypothetical protein